jgi:5'(3')-deoxyribonucleotidase
MKNKPKYILLDLDGVLSDWVGETCKIFGKIASDYDNKWIQGNPQIEKTLGISTSSLWDAINSRGSLFWENLPELPWARELYSECCKRAETFFLTSPSHDPPSLDGKLRWICKFTGDTKFRNYLIGSPKFLCASKNTVLIDDTDIKIEDFRKNGGSGVLFPQPWNKNSLFRRERMLFTLHALDCIFQGETNATYKNSR